MTILNRIFDSIALQPHVPVGVIVVAAALVALIVLWSRKSTSESPEPTRLIGCTGKVVKGCANGRHSAEARVVDLDGNRHWIRVRAVLNATLREGDEIMIMACDGRSMLLARPLCEDDIVTHVPDQPLHRKAEPRENARSTTDGRRQQLRQVA